MGEGDDFRYYLLGVVRNVARRIEGQRAKRRLPQSASSVHMSQLGVDEASLSQVFDRAWAKNIMRRAAERQWEHARERGSAATRRVELLHLRFHQGMPIREIAKLWEVPPARLHHEYARAREEFRDALLEVVGLHRTSGSAELQEEIDRLLSSLVS
jgi:RNA polymerase sigma-70 factor (ECF subfamily)